MSFDYAIREEKQTNTPFEKQRKLTMSKLNISVEYIAQNALKAREISDFFMRIGELCGNQLL